MISPCYEFASINPYSTESVNARQLASIILVLAPTVLHRLPSLTVSINTRVEAAVPASPLSMRTL